MDAHALRRALAYIDRWLAYRRPGSEVPGIAVAVSHRGRVLLDAAYGLASATTGEALTPAHRFRIASHSKTFTATAVLQLAEAGLLRLDDRAAEHLPWLSAHPDTRFARVTVRQLLAHGAGVIRDGTDADYWQLARPFPDAEEFRAEILEASLVLDPEEALKYSNYGYTLLGLVIEAVAGRPYREVVEAQILRPLRLVATGAEYQEDLPGPWASGHGRREPDGTRPILPQIDTRAMAAATGFYSTASELCCYATAHLVGSDKLLEDGSKREMQRTHWHVHQPSGGPSAHQDYGLGLIIEHVGRRRTFGHSGGFPGHITRTMADPEDQLVVSVLTNCIDGPAGDIASGILRTIDRLTSEPTPTARLRRHEGRYLNLWSVQDVVAVGGRLLVGSPDRWGPFDGALELAANGAGFRVAETSSFGSLGEPAAFSFEGGRPASLRLGGMTAWAEDRWPATRARLLQGRR